MIEEYSDANWITYSNSVKSASWFVFPSWWCYCVTKTMHSSCNC